MSGEPVQNIKIIVADDNEATLFLYKVMFNKVSKNCTFVVSGQEVIEKLDEGFDIAFIDYEMPEMNGRETAVNIKRINKNIKVIAVTGHSVASLNSNENQVFDDIITKPLSIDKIREYIDKFFP